MSLNPPGVSDTFHRRRFQPPLPIISAPVADISPAGRAILDRLRAGIPVQPPANLADADVGRISGLLEHFLTFRRLRLMKLKESLRGNFHPEIVDMWSFQACIAPNLNPRLGAKIAEVKIFTDFAEFEPLPRDFGL